MRKAVLISIRPAWCQKIANGEKTIEVRKNRPKLAPPFKCYIYCTQAKYPHEDFIETEYPKPQFYGGGKIIGEFTCKGFIPFSHGRPCFVTGTPEEIARMACLTRKEIWEYAPQGNPIGWRITDLVIYDEPHELNSFRRVCPKELDCESCAMHSEKHRALRERGAIPAPRPAELVLCGGETMNRLTKRCNGVVTYIGASNEYETGQIACEVSPQGVRELLDRLAAFEDTETEPEEIAAMRHTLDEYHKVADPLLPAKAQGRLAMLLEGSET